MTELNRPDPEVEAIDPEGVYHFAAEGLGEASIAAMLGISLKTFRLGLANRDDIRDAFDEGSALASEHLEGKLFRLVTSETATNRDKVQAFTAWARYNRHLTKRTLKAKAEALNELSTPELRAKLNSLLNRAEPEQQVTTSDRMQSLEIPE